MYRIDPTWVQNTFLNISYAVKTDIYKCESHPHRLYISRSV